MEAGVIVLFVLLTALQLKLDGKTKNKLLQDAFVDVGFTRYNLYALMLCFLTGFKATNLYAIVTCTSWGIFLSFYSSLLMDATAFGRISKCMQMNPDVFHVLNALVHFFPCVLTVTLPSCALSWYHGMIAAGLHLGWGVVQSGGTMRLDRLYVPMTKQAWYTMWVVACVTEVTVPFWLFF